MRRPTGRDLCFTLSVTDEHELVADRVSRLELVYPDSRIVLLPDGPEAALEGWPASVTVRPSDTRLYAVESGGRVVQAHLEAFLGSDALWWFKLDPDTVLRRGFRRLPVETCFFGTIQGGNPGPSLQGGCIGGTRSACSLLADSGVLLAPELRTPARTWARSNPNLLARARDGLVSFDFVHAWACRKLGIPLVDHPEVRSEWKDPPDDGHSYAVTHPHKRLDLDAEEREAARRRRVAGRLVELVESTIPAGSIVAVVSKGDERFAALTGPAARHFPADEDGGWAGYHPADSAHAIRLLEAERARGVDHLAVPETAEWWLDHYTGLARHLSTRHRLVADAPGAGWIWALEGRP